MYYNSTGGSSAAMNTLLDLRVKALTGAVVNGPPANAVNLTNGHSANYFQVVIPGLHDTSNPFTLGPAASQAFQVGEQDNSLQLVQGWPTITGNASDVIVTGTSPIFGGVFVRRGG